MRPESSPRRRREHAVRRVALCRGCGRLFHADPRRGGFCSYAGYLAQLPGTVERFWAKVSVSEADRCWLWLGATREGYGRFKLGSGAGGEQAGRLVDAHRFSFFLAHDYWPVFACHRCDVPRCVNPAHLFDGDAAANAGDAKEKGRMRKPAGFGQGSRNSRARLDEAQVATIRSEHALGGVSYAALGRRFGVSAEHVREVVLRLAWRHVP